MNIQIKEKISILIQLQSLDLKIFKLKEEKKLQPKFIEELTANFESAKNKLNLVDDRIKQSQKKRKDRELDLASKEEAIRKQQTQLYSLKTNKEYQAMLKEIEGMKADCSVLEDDILKTMDEQESLNRELSDERQNLKNAENEFMVAKKNIENRIIEIDAQLKDLDFKRSQISPGIDRGTLSVYERILSNRDGLAIVPIRNNSCQGCFMNVTAQVINEIKMLDKIITCETCSRILYLEEDQEN